MAELADLATRMRSYAQKLPVAANELKKQVAMAIETDLVNVTPVDTSQALSNWQVDTIPIAGFIPPNTPGKKGSTQAVSAGQAISEAQAVLGGVDAGTPVYVGNAAPYIVRLNEGYSTQQPAGFVERAVLIGRKMLEGVKLLG